MDPLRIFSIISWILLPTVMFGGYSLLHLQVRSTVLTPFQETCFRAGHAHAGTLLLLSLLYYQYTWGNILHPSSSAGSPVSSSSLACWSFRVGFSCI